MALSISPIFYDSVFRCIYNVWKTVPENKLILTRKIMDKLNYVDGFLTNLDLPIILKIINLFVKNFMPLINKPNYQIIYIEDISAIRTKIINMDKNYIVSALNIIYTDEKNKSNDFAYIIVNKIIIDNTEYFRINSNTHRKINDFDIDNYLFMDYTLNHSFSELENFFVNEIYDERSSFLELLSNNIFEDKLNSKIKCLQDPFWKREVLSYVFPNILSVIDNHFIMSYSIKNDNNYIPKVNQIKTNGYVNFKCKKYKFELEDFEIQPIKIH